MNAPDDKDPLARTLADWQVVPPRDPQFRMKVWARIGAEKSGAMSWAGYARANAGLVAGALAVAVALGAWTGREQARDRAEAQRTAIAASYVHDLDARWMRER